MIEAKKRSLPDTEGVAQAKRYATKLQTRFAYSTNGEEIYRIDMETGKEQYVSGYPTPQALWDETFATQVHALAVRDLINQYKTSNAPNYCVRVTAKDGQEGVFELNQKKLPNLLELKYQGVSEAATELGSVANIRGLFVGFQKYLYDQA